MKITTTLVTLINSLDKSEVRRFEAYLVYKKRKRVLQLFKLFVQCADEEELSYQIKRKKLVKNLRQNQKDLFKLLRHFWIDNIENEMPEAEVNGMIIFATAIYEKGLVQEAMKLLNKAEQTAKEKNLLLLECQANHKLLALNWIHHPDQTENLMGDYLQTQKLLTDKIALLTKISYLYHRSSYLFMKGLWALSSEQYQFLKEMGEDIDGLLDKDIETKWAVILLSLAGTYARYIKMDGALAVDYGRKLVDTLISSPPFPQKEENLTSVYTGQLISLMLVDNRTEFNETFQATEALYNELINPGLSFEIQIIFSKLLNLIYNAIFDDQMKPALKDILHFLKTKSQQVSPFYLGQIYPSVFELYYYTGQFEKATVWVESIRKLNDTSNLPGLKFSELLAEVFLNYENQNYEFIVNRCSSFQRRYSKYLKFNPAGKLLLKYFIKLSNSDSKATKNRLLLELKTEIIPLLENVRNRTMMTFWHIVPWIDSKINKFETVEAWMKQNK